MIYFGCRVACASAAALQGKAARGRKTPLELPRLRALASSYFFFLSYNDVAVYQVVFF